MYFILLFCLLFVPSTISISLVTSILESFEEKSPIHCSVVVWGPKSGLELDFADLNFPIYQINLKDSFMMKSASQACKNHIFLLNNLEDLKKIDIKLLVQSEGKYAIIVKNSNKKSIEMNLFSDQQNFFHNILDVVIILPRSEEKCIFYGRDSGTETKLKIFNIWENGSLYWKNVKMFPNRMQNLAGRVLKATSFEYRPFIYKENPGDKKYQGYEVPSWNYCM